MNRFCQNASALSMSFALAGLIGCASPSPTGHAGFATPATAGPAAALPQGPDVGARPGRPASELPAPVTIRGVRSDRQTTPVVRFDTRTFGEQIQVREPWLGPTDKVKNHLPIHGRDKTLPTLDIPALPEGEAGGFQRATATGVGFSGLSQTPLSPPDPNIAVGPGHVVQTVNDSIAFYTKSGVLQFSAPLGRRGSPGFFEGEGAGSFTFDPKCFYDHTTGRFVVHVLEVYSPTESWIDIAVSDDSDPNGVWHRYRTFSVIDIDGSTYWVDYPGMGFDQDAIYIAGNLFKLDGPGPGFAGPMIRVFDKAPLLEGQAASFVDLTPQIEGSMQVAQMHGAASSRSFMVTQAANNAIRVWTVNDPTGEPALENTVVTNLGQSNGPQVGAPNLDGGTLDTLDGRLMNVHWRDGNLYTTHAIAAAGGTRNRVRWYQIATNGWPESGESPALVQQGNVNTPGLHWFYPAIASDRFGRVGMVMARSSANEYAGVYVAGREPTDAVNTMSEPVAVKIGDRGAEGRWGDYFDIALDPNDDRTFWYVGQHAGSTGWNTWIGSFVVGCPADENGDGLVNFVDIQEFLGKYNTQSPGADIAQPFGALDFFDVLSYIARFQQGCP